MNHADDEGVARLIEPSAWEQFDRAAKCYIEERGSRNEENHFYMLTWGAGCRTLADYRKWWETCEPAYASLPVHEWRQSLKKAAAITALRTQETMPQQVFLVTGEHFHVSGAPRAIFSTLDKAQVYAMELTNGLRSWVDLPPITDPAGWEAAMEEARTKRAKDLIGEDPEGLDPEDDGWVDIDTVMLDAAT